MRHDLNTLRLVGPTFGWRVWSETLAVWVRDSGWICSETVAGFGPKYAHHATTALFKKQPITLDDLASIAALPYLITIQTPYKFRIL